MMNIDTGLAIVILAVLVFYLRLIIIQRERAKRLRTSSQPSGVNQKKGRKKTTPVTPDKKTAVPNYSILSEKKLDRVIGIIGAVFILAGVGLNLGIIPPQAIQQYWWVPTALGIVAFSWAFKL